MHPAPLLLAAAAAAGLWYISRPAPQDNGEDPLTTLNDSLSETFTAFTGIDMQSKRYADALANPKNSTIIGYLRAAENQYNIPDGLLVRQAWQESRFNPLAINRASGAKGLMQFMDATAEEWRVDQYNAASSADGAGRYMAWLYQKLGSWPLALAGYNWGIGNVLRKGMDRAPTETQNYVSQITLDAGIV